MRNIGSNRMTESLLIFIMGDKHMRNMRFWPNFPLTHEIVRYIP